MGITSLRGCYPTGSSFKLPGHGTLLRSLSGSLGLLGGCPRRMLDERPGRLYRLVEGHRRAERLLVQVLVLAERGDEWALEEPIELAVLDRDREFLDLAEPRRGSAKAGGQTRVPGLGRERDAGDRAGDVVVRPPRGDHQLVECLTERFPRVGLSIESESGPTKTHEHGVLDRARVDRVLDRQRRRETSVRGREVVSVEIERCKIRDRVG